MSDPRCHALDDYLSRELDETNTRAFERHMADCEECKGTVELERSIEAALVSANSQIQPPETLVHAAGKQYRQTSANRHRAWFAAAAALLLVAGAITVGIAKFQNHHSPSTIDQIVAEQPTADAPRKTPSNLVAARDDNNVEVFFPANQNIIATEFETEDPTVTILMVYPAVEPNAL